MPKLSPKHRAFADLIIAGATLHDAYHGSVSSTCTKDSAIVLATKLLKREDVKSYIARISAKVEERAIEATVLSMAERREFLAKVVRTPIGAINEDSPLCQSVKYSETGKEIKVPCKLRAIELDAKLSGELKDDAPKASVELVVTPDVLRQLQEGHKELMEAVA